MAAKDKSPYVTLLELAKLWRVSKSRVKQWVAKQRLPGAVRAGNQWLVPRGVRRPEKIPPGRKSKAA